jgi:hypothetical protein
MHIVSSIISGRHSSHPSSSVLPYPFDPNQTSSPEAEYEASKDRHNQEAEAPEGGDAGQAVPGRRSFSFQEGPERVQGAPTDHGNGVGDTRDYGACYHADGGNTVRQ